MFFNIQVFRQVWRKVKIISMDFVLHCNREMWIRNKQITLITLSFNASLFWFCFLFPFHTRTRERENKNREDSCGSYIRITDLETAVYHRAEECYSEECCMHSPSFAKTKKAKKGKSVMECPPSVYLVFIFKGKKNN